jgi:hypothetical protein
VSILLICILFAINGFVVPWWAWAVASIKIMVGIFVLTAKFGDSL